MPHKKVKKALGKVKKAILKRPKGDSLPDLPGPDIPTYGPLGGLLGLAMRNPYIPAALGAYALAENTERLWGPPVEAHASWTAKQWEEYQNWYQQNIRSLYAGTEIDPESALGYYPPRRGPMGPPEPEAQRAPRKVSAANKATSRAYKFLKKDVKGKLTQKKCCQLLKRAQSMASKANPRTKSRIGKGRSKNQKECRRMRKSLWGTTKRY